MSQAPRGKHDWIREHYEKMLLLVALIALLVSSVLLVQRIQVGKETAAFSLQRIGWRGSQIALRDTVPFDTVLAEARAAATASISTSPRTTVSEMRVSCVKCGRPIPYEAAECPFCLAEQPAIISIQELDTDGDGIPDWWELEHGMDPLDPSDAHKDLDGDGFTAIEEFQAGTDPRDPQSFPDPIVKLRVGGIRPVPFYLRFVGTQRMPDGTERYQLNLQAADRTYFARLGEVILGYKVEEYNPSGRGGETITMVRQSDQYSVVLVKGRPVTEQELAIRLVCLLDRTALPVLRLNDVLTHRGVNYKIVYIHRDSVVVKHETSGEEVTVPLLRSEERSLLSGRPAAPAAGAAADSPW